MLNTADYGVPQERERVIVIGVRPDLGRDPTFPKHTHSGNPSGLIKRPLVADPNRVHNWYQRPRRLHHTAPEVRQVHEVCPPGGNWRQIPDGLKPEAMDGAYDAGGGRIEFYRRLCWFEPSSTLVTSPAMKATMMVHPWGGQAAECQGVPQDTGLP